MSLEREIKAVLFDLDGVLIDSEPARWNSYRPLFQSEYGVELPEESLVKPGGTQEETISFILETYGLDGDVEDLKQKRMPYLKEEVSRSPLNPEARQTLEFLHTHGIKLALITSNPEWFVEYVLNTFSLRKYFDAIVTHSDIKKPKPHPDMYEKGLEKLGLEPHKCLAVEDTPNGICSAAEAGIKVLAYKTQYFEESELLKAGAARVINSFEDLFFEM